MCCKGKMLRWHGTYLSHFSTCSEESARDWLPVRVTSVKHVLDMTTNNWCWSVLCGASNSPPGTGCQWDLLVENMYLICPRTTDAGSVICSANKHNVLTRRTLSGTWVSQSSFLLYNPKQTVLYRSLYDKAFNRLIRESSKVFDKTKEPVSLKSVIFRSVSI